MASATIDLGLNAAPFEQGLATAERSAKSFQGRVQQLFRRDPNHRAGAALGGFIGDLSSGNIQNAVVGLTSRMRGLGLGLTVATVAGIALYEGIKKAREEGDSLADALDKVNRASGPAAFNTTESLTSKLAGIREEREKLIKHEESYGPLDALSDLTNPKNAGSSPLDNLRIARDRRAKQATESFVAEKRAMEDITTKARTLADIEEERLNGSKRRAALMESEAKFQEKYGQLIQAGPNQNPAAAMQLKRLHGIEIEAINRQNAVREAHRSTNQVPTAPGAYATSPDAYARHPDAYDSTVRQTADGKMLASRRSGLDYFRDHPRDFGFNKPRTFLTSDEDRFYAGTGGVGLAAGAKNKSAFDGPLAGALGGILGGIAAKGALGGSLGGILGAPGVLDRIEKKLDGVGANK